LQFLLRKSPLAWWLTNWKTVCTRIERLKKLEQQEQDGIFDLLPKKEVASTRKELEKLRMHLNGIKDMPRTPDVMIVVDQRRELTAIKEAISLNIPVISILDTNCDPDIVDIPIPGNDDSIGSIKLLLNTLGSNILSGQNQNID
jgi:small subunit ribosomal protein S2